MEAIDPAELVPGTITHLDLRSPEARAAAAAEAAAATRALRLCTFNIERGYELQRVIDHLKEVDADILSLQEIDIGCDRSGGKDTFREIAAALRLNGLFACEFQEMRSPLRDARSQGGGAHGNAVFSRFDFSSWRVLEHSHHPIDWESPQHPLAAKEPRKGRRVTLVADVAAPGGTLRVYNTHLEVFCGILGRVWQYSDILRDVKAGAGAGGDVDPEAHDGVPGGGQQRQQEQAGGEGQQHRQEEEEPAAGQQGGRPHLGQGSGAEQPRQEKQQAREQQPGGGRRPRVSRFAILGDLNTMANGVARLSPNYCCDALRWRTLGWSEAEYWQRYVFACAGTDPSMVNKHFMRLGLPADVCQALVNPGFFDPFDPARDITLDNPAYRLGPLHLMTGKLDWALLKGLTPITWRMGNLDFAASDHRSLVVEAE